MTLEFGVTWDYRCPFARNAHDHLIEGLLDGADWTVEFIPFSLSQVHVPDDEPDVWDEPEKDSGLLAMQIGVIVRDEHPDAFLPVHRELFDVRHRHGQSLRDRDVLAAILERNGVDAPDVFRRVDSGVVVAQIREEHTRAVKDYDVWGVPTFTSGERAVFVRVMNDAAGDPTVARNTIERVVGMLIGWPDLNEFKHTTRDR